jgi:hypothetical protein
MTDQHDPSEVRDRITRSPTQARQGIEINRMRYVLIVSMAAAIAVLLFAYLVLGNPAG